jgi:ketosteroid isomerase-like protein
MPAADPTAVVERYLALVADPGTDAAALAEVCDPGMRFVERPNLVNPRGSERDLERMLASLLEGRRLLASQRFDVVDHIVAGDRVATRVVWTGTAAEGAALPAGARLRADSAMFFTLRDGRIHRQENFDCFAALPGQGPARPGPDS